MELTYPRFGGMFSTGADLTTLGQAILSSSILPSAVSRQWLKPITHTSDPYMSVGMPWEIHRMEVDLPVPSCSGTVVSKPFTRLVDLYTKNGELGSYTTQFVLSPDHGLGFALLIASPPSTTGASNEKLVELVEISEVVTEALVPAFEAASREQAVQNFAGTYVWTENSTMALTLAADDGRPGLGVRNWTMGSLNVLQVYAALALGSPILSDESSLRLYPMDLVGGGQMAFRGVYEILQNESSTETGRQPFTSGCLAWGGVDTPQYGNVGFDDFVFDINDAGEATAITSRVARKTLKRQP